MGLGVREALVLLMFRGSVPAEALLGATLLFSLTEQVLPGLLGLGVLAAFRRAHAARLTQPSSASIAPGSSRSRNTK